MNNPSEKNSALFAVGVVSILWGTTWMASKIAVRSMPALQVSGMRHLIGGGLYVGYFFLKRFPLPTKEQFIRIFWVSLIMFVLCNGFSVMSVQYIPSGLAAVVGAMSPLWVAVFGLLIFRGTKLSAITTAGLLLGFGGVLITFYDYIEELADTNFIFGVIYGLIASITWALGTLLTVKDSKKLDPYYSMGWQMFLSGIMLSVFSFATNQHVPISSIGTECWLSLAYLIVVGSVIAFMAFIYALKRLPATQVSIHSYINPLVAIIIGDFMMNEGLTAYLVIGTIVTLLGVYLVNRGFKKV
jgi:drug/metabolite transporter (DMT)-like permease